MTPAPSPLYFVPARYDRDAYDALLCNRRQSPLFLHAAGNVDADGVFAVGVDLSLIHI